MRPACDPTPQRVRRLTLIGARRENPPSLGLAAWNSPAFDDTLIFPRKG